MQLYKERLLNAAQLRRLAEHKYSCTNISLLDPFLQPWWCWLVVRIPTWLAPNLITISGLIVNIVTTLILVWYSPDAKTEPPRWACALCGFGLFVYQTLDAIDGKQARRTNSSNALGELFDHGCDSISTIFVACSACIAVQLGYHPTWMFFQCFCAMTLFYCAHWQAYVSGALRFGRVDVTEAQITIMIIMLISAVFGPSIWTTKILGDFLELNHLMPIATGICGGIALQDYFATIFTGGVGKNGSTVAVPGLKEWTMNFGVCGVFFAGYVQSFLAFCRAFLRGGCGKNGSTVALPILNEELKIIPLLFASVVVLILAQQKMHIIVTGGVGKNGSTVAGTSVLSPVIPFSLVIVPAFIIYRKSVEHIYETHPVLYILSFGMVAAKITNKLVVAHMTKSEMEYMDWSLLGPAMLFFNQYFNTFIPENIVLWLCLVWVTIDFLRYSAQICNEICDFLHIKLFRIVPSLGSSHAASQEAAGGSLASERNGVLWPPQRSSQGLSTRNSTDSLVDLKLES